MTPVKGCMDKSYTEFHGLPSPLPPSHRHPSRLTFLLSPTPLSSTRPHALGRNAYACGLTLGGMHMRAASPWAECNACGLTLGGLVPWVGMHMRAASPWVECMCVAPPWVECICVRPHPGWNAYACSPTQGGNAYACSPTLGGNAYACSPTLGGNAYACGPTLDGNAYACGLTLGGNAMRAPVLPRTSRCK